MTKHLIPALLAIADFAAAVVCACHRDWARALYWLSAGVITFTTIQIRG